MLSGTAMRQFQQGASLPPWQLSDSVVDSGFYHTPTEILEVQPPTTPDPVVEDDPDFLRAMSAKDDSTRQVQHPSGPQRDSCQGVSHPPEGTLGGGGNPAPLFRPDVSQAESAPLPGRPIPVYPLTVAAFRPSPRVTPPERLLQRSLGGDPARGRSVIEARSGSRRWGRGAGLVTRQQGTGRRRSFPRIAKMPPHAISSRRAANPKFQLIEPRFLWIGSKCLRIWAAPG